MTKEYAWVPVLNDNEDQYIPGRYLKEDIYTGEDCLPQFDTKEDCEQWCLNDSKPKVGDVTHKGIIDTIGNCANCGVEFHIHKDETKCNFPNCKCDVEVNDSLNIKCSLTKAVYESYENKSLKWYMSLEYMQQVELGRKLINGPTFNLTIAHIMDAYEKYENNHVA
jgi:hypothetical protein